MTLTQSGLAGASAAPHYITQTPACGSTTLHAPATGTTGTGWGSPIDDSGRRPVVPTLDLARVHLPWLTVHHTSPGPESRPTSPAHPDEPTNRLRAGHRAAGHGASCAREHRRGRGAGPSGRGGP